MPNLAELNAEKARIEREIANAKPAAVTEILQRMDELGLTLADLGAAAPPPPRAGGKRMVKYSDGPGRTWTGVGQRPRWLREALLGGKRMEDFLTPEAIAQSKAKAKIA